MAESATDSPWAATVVLSSGDTAYIRPMTPDDRDALAAFHERQSTTSKYRRFFSPKPTLSSEELDHFTAVDMADRAALVMEVHDEFIAWASYERWPGRPEAEAAFMVDDEHQSQGIATLLLEHLAAIARSNGVERFTAEVLGENRAMLAVFAKAGWPLQRRFDSGVVDLDWDLAPTTEFRDSVERREQRADSRAVARILLPRAVAVVGASQRPHSIGSTLWQNVRSSVDVPVYPVNPAYDMIDGERCYASIDDLPDDVSLAIVAVPAAALEATIEACIAKKMRGAVVVTEVPIEPGRGADVRTSEAVEALVANARRHGLRLIGPSSMGIASPLEGSSIHAALVPRGVPAGNVAISLQSGPLGGSVLRRATDLGMGISWFVSLGDKADVSANDLLQFWLDDDNTTVVMMYTESIGNPRKFARIARRVSRVKPIVAVRTGAAASGELGGALFQEAGLIEVPTVGTMLDTARVLVCQPVLRGPRVAVLTNARSPGTLATAALRTAGLTPVEPPVRLDWRSTNEDYHDALVAALAADEVDGVLVLHAPGVPDNVDGATDGIDRAAHGADKPVVAVPLGARDGALREGSNVPVFSFPEQAAAVLGRSYAYGQWLATESERDEPDVSAVDPGAAQTIIAELLHEGGDGLVDVPTQHRLLATYGIAMAPASVVTADEAPEEAERLGFPVAVKSTHRRPGHSVRSGVALDLVTTEDVSTAIEAMSDALGDEAGPFIVQRMASPGVDVRIRCELDERLGVIVAVGLGGLQADVIDDRATRLAPVAPASAMALLGETRVGSALRTAGLDPSPLVAAIVQTAQLASDHRDIDSVDLNPVIVAEGEAVVVDARIALRRRTEGEPALRRID